MDKYEEFIHQQIIKETSKQDGLSQTLGTLFGGMASYFIANSTARNDYLFLSVFDTKLGNEGFKFVGVMNNFIPLKTPATKKEINNTQSTIAKNQVISNPVSEKKLNIKECSNTKIEFSESGNKLISVHFMADEKDYPLQSSVGKVISYSEEGLIFESEGIEDYFNVPDGYCISELSQAEQSWIYRLFRKGTKVKVDFYLMGSGGLPVVRKVSPYD